MPELVRSPCSLLAALRLPIIHTRSPKKLFQKSVIFGPKQAFLAVFVDLYGSKVPAQGRFRRQIGTESCQFGVAVRC